MLSYVQTLESLDDQGRYNQILTWLEEENLPYQIHPYATGKNIILPACITPKIGIGAHFDTVPGTPGANDNASAIVVSLELAKRHQQQPLRNLGLEVCIFDEEETGLKGSQAYVREVGIKDYVGFLNMELVGMGNQFVLWPLNVNSRGKVLKTFEEVSARQGIRTGRFDRIVTNSADHQSYREAGLTDSFTITCVCDEDVEVAGEYYEALFRGADRETLFQILSQAPIFEHYHQPTDFSHFLSDSALKMTADTIWETLVLLDKQILG